MSDLAQRLVLAAAKALDDAGFVDPDDGCMPTFVDRPYPEGRISTWKRPEVAGGTVVVAVLRELQSALASRAEVHDAPDYDCGWSDAHSQIVSDIRALADSIEARGTSDE